MTRNNIIILNSLVALASLAYLTLSGLLWYDKGGQTKCKQVNVKIIDKSPYHFVNDSIVREWISESKIPTIGIPLRLIDTHKIESELKKHHFIDSIQAYTTMDGELTIKLSQCIPLVRIVSNSGYDFYVDSSLTILPIQPHFRADIPMVSGESKFSFSANYYGALDKKNDSDRQLLKKITNFVNIISKDDFLQNLVVQIYINNSGGIELVPRIGEQVVVFGSLNNIEEKLMKLKKFYQVSFSQKWWIDKKIINVEYENQVIVY